MSLPSTPKSRGNVDNYFSIDDILASQERIPCKVEVPIFRLGYLDVSADSDNIMPDTRLEMPVWMARALCSRRRRIVSIDLPKQYREGYREILNADATVVDLHKLGPYYYSFGSHLANFEHTESPDIAKMLLKTFQTRFRKIMDSSQNAFNEDTSKLTEKLDEVERTLFKAGQSGLNEFQRWETRQTDKLTTSLMVQNHKKRKRIIMEQV